MRHSVKTVLLALSASALTVGNARAFEYPLQFSPVGAYKDLVVAGYQVVGKTIVGNCSYTEIRSGSGRDPRTVYIPLPQTCTWDWYGDLLSTVSGAPTVPNPVKTIGTETIYAWTSAHLFTGSDSSLSDGGFVFAYGSHYEWLTSNAYLVLPQQPYTFTTTLFSNGDHALQIKAVHAGTRLALTKATVDSTTCTGAIPVGSTCDVTVTYDDSRLTSPSGLAYDTLTIKVYTDAAAMDAFVQSYTDEVAIPSDN